MGCKDVKVEYIRVSRQGFNRNIMGCKGRDCFSNSCGRNDDLIGT